jgi:hypothetical protein
MSSSICGLLSATFAEPGYDHMIELIHQRDGAARRALRSLEAFAYAEDGTPRGGGPVPTHLDVVPLDAVAAPAAGERLMVLFDARYDARIFPYRPHHYGYLHRRGSPAPSLYYAVNAVLGGLPDRVENPKINNFETYLFLRDPRGTRFSLLLGNAARLATAEAQVVVHAGGERASREVRLAPKGHCELPLAALAGGRPLERVDVKASFRLASYLVGRHPVHDDLVVFDHLFTYAR